MASAQTCLNELELRIAGVGCEHEFRERFDVFLGVRTENKLFWPTCPAGALVPAPLLLALRGTPLQICFLYIAWWCVLGLLANSCLPRPESRGISTR